MWSAVLLLALAGTACSTGAKKGEAKTPASGTSGAVKASIKRFEVHPQRIEIASGTSVTWTNEDQVLHTITAGTPEKPLGTFDGQMPDAGTSFTYAFTKPGSYAYYCTRHSTVDALKGVVVVT